MMDFHEERMDNISQIGDSPGSSEDPEVLPLKWKSKSVLSDPLCKAEDSDSVEPLERTSPQVVKEGDSARDDISSSSVDSNNDLSQILTKLTLPKMCKPSQKALLSERKKCDIMESGNSASDTPRSKKAQNLKCDTPRNMELKTPRGQKERNLEGDSLRDSVFETPLGKQETREVRQPVFVTPRTKRDCDYAISKPLQSVFETPKKDGNLVAIKPRHSAFVTPRVKKEHHLESGKSYHCAFKTPQYTPAPNRYRTRQRLKQYGSYAQTESTASIVSATPSLASGYTDSSSASSLPKGNKASELRYKQARNIPIQSSYYQKHYEQFKKPPFSCNVKKNWKLFENL